MRRDSWSIITIITLMAASVAEAQAPDHGVGEAQVEVGGITIRYAISGPAAGESVLLVGGTGAQLIDWPPRLIEELAGRGYRVIMFDHRDSGLSTHANAAGRPDWAAVFAALAAGTPAPIPYTLQDMAADATALLDALSVERVHLVGVSMGAMIAQEIAASAPRRVLSLTTVGAGSGNPAIPLPADPARMAVVPPMPDADDLEGAIERQLSLWRALAGPGFGLDEATRRIRVRDSIARSWDPAAIERQGAAALAAGDRRETLARVQACTVVVHGADDPLVPVAAARDVAGTIPGAVLRIVPGLGHDVPDDAVPIVLDALAVCADAPAGEDRGR